MLFIGVHLLNSPLEGVAAGRGGFASLPYSKENKTDGTSDKVCASEGKI
ncbi:hypothetical protein [Parasediminibacterium sp. JCM 36343]